MRKSRPKKRIITPDSKYKDVFVSKFINSLMREGKKSTSQKIFYETMELVGDKMKNNDKSPLDIWKNAMENITPQVEVRSRRIGGATFQIPQEIRQERKMFLSIRNMILFSRKRGGKSMSEKLANEIIDAYNSQGGAFKKKEDIHKMAEANKAFSHFRL